MSWSYILRNRERWNTQGEVLQLQQKKICALAGELGLKTDVLKKIAKAGLVEVSIPFFDERVDWQLRIFPWEFLLDSATRDLRDPQSPPLTVVRHLDVKSSQEKPKPPKRTRQEPWLQVISAPGRLGQEYNFAAETRLLKLCAPGSDKVCVLSDPSPERLLETITASSPEVIHLSGFDNHQGLEILDLSRAGGVLDGYLMRSADRTPQPVEAERLATILCSGKNRPRLVAFNLYHSAARIAALSVARGAGAAVGFLDSFDDQLAELFFANFYRSWSPSSWNIVDAFQFAWELIRNQERPLQGSGIVLWTTESLLGRVASSSREAKIAREPKNRILPKPETIRDLVVVDVLPNSRLNYSVLHNNGPLFDRFRIERSKAEVGRIDGIEVNVELFVGTDSYPYRFQATLEEDKPFLELKDQVRISLTSNLSRATRESIHTSLFVEVAWNQQVLFRRTDRVTLLPIDEWRFDSANYPWLPSFVLPRDPAALRVIDAAQRYLMALRDDASAGFDGYQCVLPLEPGIDDCVLVDLQVRAIWSALLYETPLSYINPPPTFTESSQRLRTPSDCVDGKRGTCIDLALLLASCLEYVDIYPAIFLLRTHAFPAYWRHESYHREFCEGSAKAVLEAEGDQGETGQRVSWVLRRGQYREILGEVQGGRLVPIESTLVTGHGGFADAVSTGIKNLASRREFESMVDILLARTDKKSSVTPLPIRRSEL